ncbi:hypothetical protein HDV57DRAFT_456622 [Trichoderma longibrachiatum]
MIHADEPGPSSMLYIAAIVLAQVDGELHTLAGGVVVTSSPSHPDSLRSHALLDDMLAKPCNPIKQIIISLLHQTPTETRLNRRPSYTSRQKKKKKKKTWPSPTLLVPLLLLLSPLSCPFYPLPCNLIRTCSQPTSMHPFQTGDPSICPSPPALCIHSLFCTLHRKYHPPCFMFLHLQLHTPLCLFVYLRLLHLGSLLHVPTGFDAANVPSPPYTHPSLGSLPPPSLFPSLFVLPLACFMTRTMFSCFLLYLSKSLQNM